MVIDIGCPSPASPAWGQGGEAAAVIWDNLPTIPPPRCDAGNDDAMAEFDQIFKRRHPDAVLDGYLRAEQKIQPVPIHMLAGVSVDEQAKIDDPDPVMHPVWRPVAVHWRHV